MMSQKDGVVNAWKQGESDGLTGKDLLEFTVEEVYHGLMAGDIKYNKPTDNEKAVRAYSRALVQNWSKKAVDINGGVKYVPDTKRGPRVSDQRMKDLSAALKALVANNADQSLIAKVSDALEVRRNELEADKAKKNLPSLSDAISLLSDLGIDVG